MLEDERWKARDLEPAKKVLKEYSIRAVGELKRKTHGAAGSKECKMKLSEHVGGYGWGELSAFLQTTNIQPVLSAEQTLHKKILDIAGGQLSEEIAHTGQFSRDAIAVKASDNDERQYDIHIVQGPSGSGKTVYAINRLAFLSKKDDKADLRACAYYSLSDHAASHYIQTTFVDRIGEVLKAALKAGSDEKWQWDPNTVFTLDAVNDLKKGHPIIKLQGCIGAVIQIVIGRYAAFNGIGKLLERQRKALAYAVFHELDQDNGTDNPRFPKFGTLSSLEEGERVKVKRQAQGVMDLHVEVSSAEDVRVSTDFVDDEAKKTKRSVSITPAMSMLLYNLLGVDATIYDNWGGLEVTTALHAVYLETLSNFTTQEKGVCLARLTKAVPPPKATKRIHIPSQADTRTIFINGERRLFAMSSPISEAFRRSTRRMEKNVITTSVRNCRNAVS
ncbi:unknown protein [Seminavis robusta]|uniref:Uncharacterized protein n=1 Tax=Seminavis robusta TaxID=568900 RepID=A0A9N8EUJ6_9STRA|nr:unknown protein [Seminavis robusta]|eukprot:Sro1803_g298590.1 n/a (446) ;mRNA; f:1937-3615